MSASVPFFLAAFIPWPDFIEQSGSTLKDGQVVEAVVASSCAPLNTKQVLELVVAVSDPFQRKGLSKRKRPLADHEGMLFYFQPRRIGEIWMKDTWIPLQLVHISPDGRVMKLQEMEVEPDPTNPSRIYRAWPAVNAVVELKPKRLKPSDEGKLFCVRKKSSPVKKSNQASDAEPLHQN